MWLSVLPKFTFTLPPTVVVSLVSFRQPAMLHTVYSSGALYFSWRRPAYVSMSFLFNLR